MSTEILKQAYALITQGNKADAVKLLMPILKSDRDNKNAWWLMAHAAPNPEQIEFALKNVLRLDPYHQTAQAKLNSLQAESAADFFSTVAPAQPLPVDDATMSYFESSYDSHDARDVNWASFGASEIAAASDAIMIQPRATGTMPLYQSLERKEQKPSASNANFWFAAAAIILVGICAMTGILYSAGTFDSFLGVLPDAPPPQAGWSTYTGNDLTIQLPDHWQDIDLTGNSDAMLDLIAQRLPEFADAVEEARGDPDLYRFLALNEAQSSGIFTTNIVITSEPVGYFMSLDSYLDISVRQLPESIEIINQSTREIEPFGEVGVVEANPTLEGVNFRQTYYVVKRRNRVWVILFSADARLYDNLRPDFEYSLSTFRPE